MRASGGKRPNWGEGGNGAPTSADAAQLVMAPPSSLTVLPRHDHVTLNQPIPPHPAQSSPPPFPDYPARYHLAPSPSPPPFAPRACASSASECLCRRTPHLCRTAGRSPRLGSPGRPHTCAAPRLTPHLTPIACSVETMAQTKSPLRSFVSMTENGREGKEYSRRDCADLTPWEGGQRGS